MPLLLATLHSICATTCLFQYVGSGLGLPFIRSSRSLGFESNQVSFSSSQTKTIHPTTNKHLSNPSLSLSLSLLKSVAENQNRKTKIRDFAEMVAEDHSKPKTENQKLVFTYGTLKTGFSNHGLIQEMIRTGDAVFIGAYRTIQKYPLVCGPFRVPFLLNLPGKGNRIKGELYAVSEFGLTRMDELEGISKGHYERLPVEIIRADDVSAEEMNVELVKAVAYYGHRSYAEGLWKRNGEKGFVEYSKEEAKGYVKRDCRPKNITFLEQIRLFISSSSGFD